MRRFLGAFVLAALVLSQAGCARGVESWVVRTRNNQGDRALNAGNLNEAALAYRLALQVSPLDEHARTGLVSVQLNLADRTTATASSRRRSRRWGSRRRSIRKTPR